ncbi:DUF7532 family protein [Halorarius litoreus]|uniref:DUF7532 family protein n=1 Tax=Halorarius litoreus TaxID=2962676 RepID=UPI0020CE0BFA|nr:hypothetical protein [Halorarius litoreus]
MHFDQREQAALREVGLDTDDLQRASQLVADAVDETATELEAFFDREVVYSDMDLAHSAAQFAEHTVRFLDTYTHAAVLQGWLRFETWGVAVEDGRVLADDVVELTLAGRHGRTRFATTPEAL